MLWRRRRGSGSGGGIIMATGWLTFSTLKVYFDTRLVAQLSSDVDPPVDPVLQVDDTVTAHLDAAQQFIENALSVGQRYTPPFLDAEITEFIRSIQARLTIHTLALRRGSALSDEHVRMIDEAHSYIEQMQSGKIIPGLLDESANARKLQVVFKNPSVNQRIDRGLISDEVSGGRFFPRRTGVNT